MGASDDDGATAVGTPGGTTAVGTPGGTTAVGTPGGTAPVGASGDPAAQTDRTGRSPEIIRSLARGLSVVRAFDAAHPRLTLSEVATRARMPRAGARRALHTLVELGYASRSGREFTLRPRLLELGFEQLSGLSLADVVTPHLQALSAHLDESVSASVLDAGQIVYVARVATRRVMRVQIRVGSRFPAESTAMGRVLLAARSPEWIEGFVESVRVERRSPYTTTDTARLRAILSRTRAQGWALVDQELEEGLRSVAVPVHDGEGTVVAAVNVATTVIHDEPAAFLDRVLPHLRRTAAAIDADLVPLGHVDS